MKNKKNPLFWGIIASIGMTIVYFGIMLLSMEVKNIWLVFLDIGYLIIPIIIGFGVQIALMVKIKNNLHQGHGSIGITTTTGVVSGTAMLACCAHHAIDLLAIIGLSGAAMVISNYQKEFLGLGLSITMFGIAYMLIILYRQQTTILNLKANKCH